MTATKSIPLAARGTTLVLIEGPDGSIDHLSETILGEMVDGQPRFVEVAGRRIQVRLPDRGLMTRAFYREGKYVGQVANLPPDLAALNAIVGGRGIGVFATSLDTLVRQQIADRIYRVKVPGIMRFAVTADGQLQEEEVAISIYDACRFLVSRLLNGDPRWTDAVQKKAGWLFDLVRHQAQNGERIPISLGLLLDQAEAFVVRYPNASDTSGRRCRMRIYKGAPNGVFMPARAMVELHQGDCDGDRLFVAPLTVGGGKGLWLRPDLTPTGEEVTLPETPKTVGDIFKAADGMSVRGDYIGLLTYAYWIMAYEAERNASKLEMEPAEAWRQVNNLITPLIEGVMDARKGEDSLARQMAETVLGVLQGRLPIDRLNILPTEGQHAFTQDQIALMKRIAALGNPTGANRWTLLGKVLAEQSPIGWLVARRGNGPVPQWVFDGGAEALVDGLYLR